VPTDREKGPAVCRRAYSARTRTTAFASTIRFGKAHLAQRNPAPSERLPAAIKPIAVGAHILNSPFGQLNPKLRDSEHGRISFMDDVVRAIARLVAAKGRYLSQTDSIPSLPSATQI
jgi:hypothetical protein